jgi:predicted  nucleic acid-binding Zn-ribbon protein
MISNAPRSARATRVETRQTNSILQRAAGNRREKIARLEHEIEQLKQEIERLRRRRGDSGEENHSFRRHVDHARSEATLAAFMLA